MCVPNVSLVLNKFLLIFCIAPISYIHALCLRCCMYLLYQVQQFLPYPPPFILLDQLMKIIARSIIKIPTMWKKKLYALIAATAAKIKRELMQQYQRQLFSLSCPLLAGNYDGTRLCID